MRGYKSGDGNRRSCRKELITKRQSRLTMSREATKAVKLGCVGRRHIDPMSSPHRGVEIACCESRTANLRFCLSGAVVASCCRIAQAPLLMERIAPCLAITNFSPAEEWSERGSVGNGNACLPTIIDLGENSHILRELGGHVVEGDIHGFERGLPRGADLAWASFPCQDLSCTRVISGRRRPDPGPLVRRALLDVREVKSSIPERNRLEKSARCLPCCNLGPDRSFGASPSSGRLTTDHGKQISSRRRA